MTFIRKTFNILCFFMEGLMESVMCALLLITSPIWLVPILMIDDFDRSVTPEYKNGDKWWFKIMNKKEKAKP